jgi:hypothetical protein
MQGCVPRDDRNPVSIEAAVRLDGRSVPVTVINVSGSGCNVRCLEALPIGQVVQLEIPAFQPQPASVRWSLGGRAGLRFV